MNLLCGSRGRAVIGPTGRVYSSCHLASALTGISSGDIWRRAWAWSDGWAFVVRPDSSTWSGSTKHPRQVVFGVRRFNSAARAAKELGLTKDAIYKRIYRGYSGWKFANGETQ